MIDPRASMGYVGLVCDADSGVVAGRGKRAPAWGTPVAQLPIPVPRPITTCRGAPLRGFSVSADRSVRAVCGGRNVLPHAKALPGVPALVTPSYGTDGALRVDSAPSPGACGTAALATAQNGTIANDGEGFGRPRPQGRKRWAVRVASVIRQCRDTSQRLRSLVGSVDKRGTAVSERDGGRE